MEKKVFPLVFFHLYIMKGDKELELSGDLMPM